MIGSGSNNNCFTSGNNPNGYNNLNTGGLNQNSVLMEQLGPKISARSEYSGVNVLRLSFNAKKNLQKDENSQGYGV
jgi:hypothetical protein